MSPGCWNVLDKLWRFPEKERKGRGRKEKGREGEGREGKGREGNLDIKKCLRYLNKSDLNLV